MDKRLYFDENGNDITEEILKEIDVSYHKGRLEQAKEDAGYCQEHKDKHNEAVIKGEKFPINFGTIVGICCHMWKRVKDLEDKLAKFGDVSSSDIVRIHTSGLEEEIRCKLCKNNMKSDKGCDGGCVVDDKLLSDITDIIKKRMMQ